MTSRLPTIHPSAVEQAVDCLRDGGVVILPTDTVYGLAASLDSPAALAHIFAVKGRPQDRTLPILLSSTDALARVSSDLNGPVVELARRFWPGPVTVVLPARAGLPKEVLGEGDTVGVRVPDLAFTRAIIAAAGGALAVTSANRSGEPPAMDADAAMQAIGAKVGLVLDGGSVSGGVPSTVVRITEGRPEILRAGAVPAAEIQRVWRELIG